MGQRDHSVQIHPGKPEKEIKTPPIQLQEKGNAPFAENNHLSNKKLDQKKKEPSGGLRS